MKANFDNITFVSAFSSASGYCPVYEIADDKLTVIPSINSSCRGICDDLFQIDGDYEVSYDMEWNWGSSAGFRHIIQSVDKTDTSSSTVERYGYGFENNENGTKYINTIITSTTKTSVNSYTSTQPVKVTHKIVGTTLQQYIDDTLVKTTSNLTFLHDTMRITLHQWGGNKPSYYHRLSNFKVKPL